MRRPDLITSEIKTAYLGGEMNIKYIGRNLLLVSMAIAMSACGGSKDDAPGNGVLNDPNYKTFVGFWEMSETCMDQLDESTGKSSKFCYENNNKNENEHRRREKKSIWISRFQY